MEKHHTFIRFISGGSMDNEQLHRLLDEIHSEIDSSNNLSKRDRTYLLEIEADIRRRLNEPEENRLQSNTSERLQESIDRLEVTHPHLTMMLSDLMNILSNTGI